MATTDAPVVCDAGPLIHLDELGCLDLLSDFSPLMAPIEVWDEVVRHRRQLSAETIGGLSIVHLAHRAPSVRLKSLIDALGLHAGERAALMLCERDNARLLLCDDAAARLAAESLCIAVHGTIGVLVRSIRRGLQTQDAVLTILEQLPI